MKKQLLSTLTCGLAAVSLHAMPADYDGSKTLLCATQYVSQCDTGVDCVNVFPASVNVPDFFVVNTADKLIGAVNDDRTTPVERVEHLDGKLILQGADDGVEDVRDAMWELEKDDEIVVHRIGDEHRPRMAKTIYGWDKKVPTNQLWHHKSCGQCGNIPGYPASLLWLMNEMGVSYLDETDQTSCTAWNYHGSGIGNIVSLAAVFLRNFHQPYISSPAQAMRAGHYYALLH